MTVEDLVQQINEAGILVNNLFQLGRNGWQANLTDGEAFSDFGRGETMVEALKDAWAKASAGRENAAALKRFHEAQVEDWLS